MKYLLLFLILFSITACDISSPQELDEAEIKDILRALETAFTFQEPETIMQHYHPEFLHGTNSYSAQQIIWEIRLNDHDLMKIENIEIDLNERFATAQFFLTFDDQTTNEPSAEYGDMSYFYREYDQWKLCGDNFILP